MFLKNFDKRMKRVGVYSLLIKNSINKNTWKNYKFDEYYEQINLIFAVLLFIMEQSLKDENCTIDDIGGFIDDTNMKYFKKSLSYEESIELAKFIVNTVLCDEGKTMYFQGYNFEENKYKDIYVSFLSNKIVYVNDAQRRVSYSLSDEGYSLMLSTLEIENNLQITIQEIIFKEHLKKANYDKAVDDIKNIFNSIKIQLQKMNDAIKRIRNNVLSYSVEEYKNLLNDNLDSLEGMRSKLVHHREVVNERIKKLKHEDINISKLNEFNKNNLKNLMIIEKYLNQSIEEQQSLLSAHFDFKYIYSRELEEMSAMSIIQRFNFQSDLYDKVLENPSYLENIDYILRSLFISEHDKIYNINKCMQYQRKIEETVDEVDEEISFEEVDYLREKEEKAKEKLRQYKLCLSTLLNLIVSENKESLFEIAIDTAKDESLKENLIPSIEVFREVIIELLRSKKLNIIELKEERQNSVSDKENYEFNLTYMLLEIIESNYEFNFIEELQVYKNMEHKEVKFYEVKNDNKIIKSLNCSDIIFKLS